jgi:cytochrome c553
VPRYLLATAYLTGYLLNNLLNALAAQANRINHWRSNMKKLAITFIAATLSFGAMAGDPAAGKAKSMTCAGCHGMNGISNNGMWPNLAGQKEAYLASQLKMFRDGKRNNAMMTAMAKGLSDTDIANLSAYYANL